MRFVKRRLELTLEVGLSGVELFLRNVAATHESFGVQATHRALGLDEVVHHGLGHRGVVTLVVPATTVGDEVDHHVLLELLAKLHGETGNAHHGLGVVAVDVPDGGLNRLGHVGGVDRRARLPRGRGEADLVVDRDVHGATDAVAAQLRHLHAFVNHALSAHGGIAVNQNRKGGEGADGLAVLFGPHDALKNSVDGLEVRGVSG